MSKSKIGVSFVSLALAAVFCFCVAFPVSAQESTPAPKPRPGDELPAFVLKDYNGKEYALNNLEGKVVVLDFSSQECPYSRGVDPHLAELAKSYEGKDVVFLSIDSHFKTTVEEIKKYAEENKLPFPILKDEGNVYADMVGATRTPEFYVLNKELVLVYHGPFDDRKEPDKKGETEYLRNAIDKTLAGKPVEPSEVKVWGCTIKRAEKKAQ
ncbi:MAG TPA: redoxin domain-containing protein [Candidatus Hydrogenedentes bacterium]|nr:redoxin domain-containing protein [Candidatus Hydrogenedentota bacterium]HOL75898.1 redoxin domain-containing protein [Candidatus Hydrogenedentota bacterium]HPO85693.1 redoxin domain-containing protein [Candidatus Hydrogenedentota bacterium]